ncbi:MAG TPA: cysteine desulfurase family protein [Kofleriaceae bacterium]|nr:cysteine desulfurase family protein [Kofleriaceae bacterium]
MSSIHDYVQHAIDAGTICLIGGHCAFPGAPSAFAFDSARDVMRLAAGRPADRVQTLVFLDDIAASEACSAIGCELPAGAPARLQSADAPAVARWITGQLPVLERRLLDPEPTWRDLAQPLAQAVRDDLGGRVPTRAQDALRGDPGLSLDAWLQAVEVLTYVVDRARFRPLAMTRRLGQRLPTVAFERSMVNAASRMLHKLKKQIAPGRGLQIARDGDQDVFWVQGDDRRRIELRHEIHGDSDRRAANKCAAILSQLFHHCCKQLARGARGARLTVLYVVPCYDRARLDDGLCAFEQLYGDVERWFGASEVRVVSAIYTDPERDALLCDERILRAGALPGRATRQLAGTAPRARRGAAPRSIYVDNNATTAVDPVVVAELLPFLTSAYGNPSSAHSFGWTAELAVSEAATAVARLIGAEPDEVFFTSGATEADNWILVTAQADARTPIVTTAVEHKAVLEAAVVAEQAGRPVIWLPVDADGRADLDALEALDLPPRSLVSLMAVNNEIHGVLDLARAGAICARKQAIFHTDAAQALGVVPIDVRRMQIHAASLSAHKVYGPKGIGALYIARELQPVLRAHAVGGGQQRGMRAGTLPTALIVGMGKACALAADAAGSEPERLRALSRQFLDRLDALGVPYRLIGPAALADRRPGGLCLALPGLDGTRLCDQLPEIALSQGSACNSRGVGSHVLRALGFGLAEAKTVIRIAFGRFNTTADVRYVADRLADVILMSSRLTAHRWSAERSVAG